jgi:thiol-disulfide isomerase/thioredoxin
MYTPEQIFILPGPFACKMIKKVFLFLTLFYGVMTGYAQTNTTRSGFRIIGHITGRDTGKIVIWYKDPANLHRRDTTTLDHGQFTFSGEVRAACEALIWTDLHTIDVDDPSVIRFILTPAIIHISKVAGPQKATITGGKAQAEKEKWDGVKLPHRSASDRFGETARSLRKLEKQTGQSYASQIDSLYRKMDSIRAIIIKLDAGYVARHPESYVSGFLLSRWCRRLSVDTIMRLYTALADSVKNSSLGYEVLSYAYPTTNDSEFRKNNPLISDSFTKQLAGITSIHDLRLKDLSGNWVDLNAFKGKYLLLDVWTSGCKPCIANIPLWTGLTKRYDPAIVQFVSVSLDTEVNAWKNAVEKYKPGGLQLIDTSSFTGLFAIYCKVLWVGKYLIADPDGKIINYDSQQDSEAEWQKLLDNLLK